MCYYQEDVAEFLEGVKQLSKEVDGLEINELMVRQRQILKKIVDNQLFIANFIASEYMIDD